MFHYFSDLVRTTDESRSRREVRVPALLNPQSQLAGALASAALRVDSQAARRGLQPC